MIPSPHPLCLYSKDVKHTAPCRLRDCVYNTTALGQLHIYVSVEPSES